VRYWEIGNEPDRYGGQPDARRYCEVFRAQATAMRAIDPARQATWYAFTALATLSGELVPATVDGGDLWVHAARDGGRLDVLLVNRSATPKRLSAKLPGYQLRAATYFDEVVVKDEKPPAELGVGAEVRLPARSVIHLVYAKG
jgi:hypothetical protein